MVIDGKSDFDLKSRGKSKFVKVFGILLGIAGFIGSLWVEFGEGEMPCPFCLTIRYSLLAVSLLLIGSFFFKKLLYLSLIPIITALVADVILISNEMSSHAIEAGLCGQENICKTPQFLGINLSIWAIMFIIPIGGAIIHCINIERKSENKRQKK